MTRKSLAQRAYETFTETRAMQLRGKGHVIATKLWTELDDDIQTAWYEAVLEVAALIKMQDEARKTAEMN